MRERSNEDWLVDLKGERGNSQQNEAFADLSNYMYRVVYNYLLKRQVDLAILADFAPEELAALAQEFVQEAQYKVIRDNFELLSRFREEGRFTSFMAQIIIRIAGGELRKPYWTRRAALPEAREYAVEPAPIAFDFIHVEAGMDMEHIAIQRQLLEEIGKTLQACLNKLDDRRCTAFWHCVVIGRSAQDVAAELGTTTNAVYLLILRAKRALVHCLQKANIGPDVLDIFA